MLLKICPESSQNSPVRRSSPSSPVDFSCQLTSNNAEKFAKQQAIGQLTQTQVSRDTGVSGIGEPVCEFCLQKRRANNAGTIGTAFRRRAENVCHVPSSRRVSDRDHTETKPGSLFVRANEFLVIGVLSVSVCEDFSRVG